MYERTQAEHMKVGERKEEGSRKKRNYLHGKELQRAGLPNRTFSQHFWAKKSILFWFSLKQESLHTDPPRVYVEEMLNGSANLLSLHVATLPCECDTRGYDMAVPPFPLPTLIIHRPPPFHAAQYISGGGWYKKKGVVASSDRRQFVQSATGEKGKGKGGVVNSSQSKING